MIHWKTFAAASRKFFFQFLAANHTSSIQIIYKIISTSFIIISITFNKRFLCDAIIFMSAVPTQLTCKLSGLRSGNQSIMQIECKSNQAIIHYDNFWHKKLVKFDFQIIMSWLSTVLPSYASRYQTAQQNIQNIWKH